MSLQQVESSDSSQRSCNKFLDTSPRFVRLSRFTGSDVTDTSQDTVYRLRPGIRVIVLHVSRQSVLRKQCYMNFVQVFIYIRWVRKQTASASATRPILLDFNSDKTSKI